MGALTLQKLGQHNDNIDIVTTEVQEQSDGSLAKKCSVRITATSTRPASDLWIGLKIDDRQKVLGLSVNRSSWVARGTPLDANAMGQFNRLMPPRQGEKWAAYRVDRSNLPITFTFETELKLNRHVASYPDAQTVAIVVCYVPEAGKPLERKDILLGHSLVQAPPPNRKRAKKRK